VSNGGQDGLWSFDRKGLGVEALGGDGRDNAAGLDDGFNANDILMVTVMMEEIKWKQLTG